MLILRFVLHGTIFFAFFLIFTLGLGVSLAVNPVVGIILCLLAGVIAVCNVLWMLMAVEQCTTGTVEECTREDTFQHKCHG